MRTLALCLLLVPAIASADNTVVDQTFKDASSHAHGMTAALATSMVIPDDVKLGPLELVTIAKAHVSGRPIKSHYAMPFEGTQAVIDTVDGRSSKIDSDGHFLGVYGHDRTGVTQHGEMYLFPDPQSGKLGAVSWLKLKRGTFFQERIAEKYEAYRVPGTKRETWLVFSKDEQLAKGENPSHFPKTETIVAMQAAGIDVRDTGLGRGIIPTKGFGVAVKKLMKTNPNVRVVRAPR